MWRWWHFFACCCCCCWWCECEGWQLQRREKSVRAALLVKALDAVHHIVELPIIFFVKFENVPLINKHLNVRVRVRLTVRVKWDRERVTVKTQGKKGEERRGREGRKKGEDRWQEQRTLTRFVSEGMWSISSSSWGGAQGRLCRAHNSVMLSKGFGSSSSPCARSCSSSFSLNSNSLFIRKVMPLNNMSSSGCASHNFSFRISKSSLRSSSIRSSHTLYILYSFAKFWVTATES